MSTISVILTFLFNSPLITLPWLALNGLFVLVEVKLSIISAVLIFLANSVFISVVLAFLSNSVLITFPWLADKGLSVAFEVKASTISVVLTFLLKSVFISAFNASKAAISTTLFLSTSVPV